jgi:hypothetical protein
MSNAAYLRALILLCLFSVALALSHYWWAIAFYVLACINHHYATK